MARTYAYSADFDKDIENLFKEAKLLGEGHNGIAVSYTHLDVYKRQWVDLTKSLLYILLPLSIVVSLFLVSQGVVQNFKQYQEVKLIDPYTLEDGTVDVYKRQC